MPETEFQTVVLQDDFYRDSFGKVIFIITGITLAIALLVATAVYFYVTVPKPVNFVTAQEWRVQQDVSIDQRYLTDADVLQWVSNVFQKAFLFDFYHYNDQLKAASQYFTSDGWKVFLNQLNIYANYNTVLNNKIFVNSVPKAAPTIINQGLLSGKYAWWIQIPLDIHYSGYNPLVMQSLTMQVLVVRVPTLNNLFGVGIDNVIVAKTTATSILPSPSASPATGVGNV